MGDKRRLTEAEKKKISAKAYITESAKYPNASITIEVADEIDENGRVHYHTVSMTESELSESELSKLNLK